MPPPLKAAAGPPWQLDVVKKRRLSRPQRPHDAHQPLPSPTRGSGEAPGPSAGSGTPKKAAGGKLKSGEAKKLAEQFFWFDEYGQVVANNAGPPAPPVPH
eukprot:EG_transcript_47364